MQIAQGNSQEITIQDSIAGQTWHHYIATGIAKGGVILQSPSSDFPILLIELVILPHIEPACARDLLCTRVDPCWLPVSSLRVIRGFRWPAFPVISSISGVHPCGPKLHPGFFPALIDGFRRPCDFLNLALREDPLLTLEFQASLVSQREQTLHTQRAHGRPRVAKVESVDTDMVDSVEDGG